MGRDTQNLTAEGVTKAAVETVAENASDGVIAPLLYMLLGGALGCLYLPLGPLFRQNIFQGKVLVIL